MVAESRSATAEPATYLLQWPRIPNRPGLPILLVSLADSSKSLSYAIAMFSTPSSSADASTTTFLNRVRSVETLASYGEMCHVSDGLSLLSSKRLAPDGAEGWWRIDICREQIGVCNSWRSLLTTMYFMARCSELVDAKCCMLGL